MDQAKVIEIITCPICFGLCEPPISTCMNGHLICNRCKKVLERTSTIVIGSASVPVPACPTCRITIWSRNLSLENMTLVVLANYSYPCPNECGTTLVYGKAQEHFVTCNVDGEACLDSNCRKIISRVKMVEHVRSEHPAIRDLICIIGGDMGISLGGLRPIEFTAFSPKNSSLGHYILRVYEDETLASAWLLIKRHRKSHVEIGMECLQVHADYKYLVYALSAHDTKGSRAGLILTSTTSRLRDKDRAGVIIKDSPAYTMNMFQVAIENQSTLQLTITKAQPDNDLPPKKRARIDISSEDVL